MAQVSISPTLSAFVATRIANYAAEATEEYHRLEAPSVAEFKALPLIRHWFETIGLRADGEIVAWSTDGPSKDYFAGIRQVDDRYDWLSALVEGSRRFPELTELLPIRGANAIDCRCGGTQRFICPECCGLGWV